MEPEVESSLVPESWVGRALRWSKVLSSFFATHVFVQASGLLAGLLVVNFLPTSEFALYTLAMSFLTFLIFLTDLGATSSLAHFHREEVRLGAPGGRFVGAVRSLRHRAVLVVGGLGSAVLLYGLVQKGFEPGPAVLAALAVLFGVALQVESAIGLMELRLEDRFSATYRAELAGAIVRLVSTALLIGFGWLLGWMALVTSVLGALVTVLFLTRHRLHVQAGDFKDERRRVLRYLVPTLPSALFFSVQGPLVVWLAATLGSTRSLAEVGALGRLGLIVGAIGSLSGVVLLPKLSRISDEGLWRRRHWQFALLVVALSLPLLALSAGAPGLLLGLLGETYSGLSIELILVVATACVGLLDGYLVGVNNARSWTRLQAPALVVLVAAQALLAGSLTLGTTLGLVCFGFWSRVVSCSCQILIAAMGRSREGWVKWSTT